MPKARRPLLCHPLKALRKQMLLAVPLPIAPRIGVPIESKTERADRVFITLLHPFFGPGFLWQPNPGGYPPQKRLRVGLDRVRLFRRVSRKQAVHIARLASLERGRATA